jgi:hypothetical protein
VAPAPPERPPTARLARRRGHPHVSRLEVLRRGQLRAPRREPGDRPGRVRLSHRPQRRGEDDLAQAAVRGGAAQRGSDRGPRAQHRAAGRVGDSSLAPPDRRGLPGLQAAAAPHGGGECLPRPRRGRDTASSDTCKGLRDPQTAGAAAPPLSPSPLALRRRAAAGRHRARPGERARDPARRRADGKSGSRPHARHHGPDRERGHARNHGDRGHARARHREPLRQAHGAHA